MTLRADYLSIPNDAHIFDTTLSIQKLRKYAETTRIKPAILNADIAEVIKRISQSVGQMFYYLEKQFGAPLHELEKSMNGYQKICRNWKFELVYAEKELVNNCFYDCSSNLQSLQNFIHKEFKVIFRGFFDIKKHLILSEIHTSSLVRLKTLLVSPFNDDEEIFLEIIKKYKDPFILNFATLRLRSSYKFIAAAIRIVVSCLEFAHENLKKDKNLALMAVSQNGMALQFVDPSLQNDKEVVIISISQCGEAFKFASPLLQKDKELALIAFHQSPYFFSKSAAAIFLQNEVFVVLAVSLNGELLFFADEILKDKKNVVLKAVQQNGLCLEFVSDRLKKCKEVVSMAVKNNGLSLQFANPLLKKDKELARLAIEQNGLAYQWVDQLLQDDPDLFFLAMQKDPAVLKKIGRLSTAIKNYFFNILENHLDIFTSISFQFAQDKKIFLAALSLNGLLLKYADMKLKQDKDLVLIATSQNGLALEFASDHLKDDIDIAKVALLNTVDAYAFLSPRLKENLEILVKVVAQSSKMIIHIPEKILKDKAILTQLMPLQGNLFEHIVPVLKWDRELAELSVTHSGSALKFLPDSLKKDQSLVLKAIENDATAIKYAHSSLILDKNFIFKAIKKNIHVLPYVINLRNMSEKDFIKIIADNWKTFHYLNPYIRQTRDFALWVIGLNGNALEYLEESYQKDKQIVMAAVNQDRQAIRFASLEFDLDDFIEIYFSNLNSTLKNQIGSIVKTQFLALKRNVKSIKHELFYVLKTAVIHEKVSDSRLNQFSLNILEPILNFHDQEVRLLLISHLFYLSDYDIRELEKLLMVKAREKFIIYFSIFFRRLQSFLPNLSAQIDPKEIWGESFKDTKNQRLLFLFINVLVILASTLPAHQKSLMQKGVDQLLLSLCFSTSSISKKEFIEWVKCLSYIQKLYSLDTFLHLLNRSFSYVKQFVHLSFLKLFKLDIDQPSLCNEGNEKRYLATFAQFRQPFAIFEYAKILKGLNEEFFESLRQYVYHVLKGDLSSFRNDCVEDQRHLKHLYKNTHIKTSWSLHPCSFEIESCPWIDSANIGFFLGQQIMKQMRFKSPLLFLYFQSKQKNAYINGQLYLDKIENLKKASETLCIQDTLKYILQSNIPVEWIPESYFNPELIDLQLELEKNLLLLIENKISLIQFKHNRENIFKDSPWQSCIEGALGDDLTYLFNQSSLKDSQTYLVTFTEDPCDLLLLGTEVIGSCHNVYLSSTYNECLLSYMINGECQAIVVKDKHHKIQARAILRILVDTKDQPCLFLEKIYANTSSPDYLNAIIKMARKKSELMQLPLLSVDVFSGPSYPHDLQFLGGRAPSVYSDAAQGVFSGSRGFVIKDAYYLSDLYS